MPFWDPQFALRQLKAIIPTPEARESGSARVSTHPAGPGPRCGCCPRCRAFVRIEPKRAGEMVPCPNCGRPIGFVKPLDDDLPPLE